MAQLHSLLTANHRPYAGVYADSTERLAATGFVRQLGGGVVAFTADDLYKKVLQLDNATEWVLTAITPTWVQIGGGGLTPAAHAASHENGGSDELSVAGLSGVLADPQLAGALVETSGPTVLIVDDVVDGEFLKRVGSTVVSAVPAGTGAEAGANSDITSMDGLTGALQAPTQINDANGNEVLKFGSTGSAINEVTVTNKAAGNGPTVEATGGDTNIDLALVSKGSGVVKANGVNVLLESLEVFASDLTTALTTGTGKGVFFMPYAMSVTEVFAGLATPQTSGSTFTVDINEAGSTILSTKITIDNTEDTSLSAATPPVISDAALAKGAKITIDIDQVGDGTAMGLVVVITGVRG